MCQMLQCSSGDAKRGILHGGLDVGESGGGIPQPQGGWYMDDVTREMRTSEKLANQKDKTNTTHLVDNHMTNVKSAQQI